MNTKNIRHCEACGQVRFPSDHWQRKLAAAIASFSEERERAQREGERVIAAIEQRDKARNDALEEAAKVCDRLRNKNYSSEEWVAGTDDCAAAIRAMGRGSS